MFVLCFLFIALLVGWLVLLLYVPSQQLFIALCLFELCFTLRFVFLVSCNPYCSVALTHGAMGWSAVCDCDYPCLRSNWRIQGGGGFGNHLSPWKITRCYMFP